MTMVCSLNELESSPQRLGECLSPEREMVILKDGKVRGLMLGVGDFMPGELDEILDSLRGVVRFREMRARATANGFMSDEEIDKAIQETRGEAAAKRAVLA